MSQEILKTTFGCRVAKWFDDRKITQHSSPTAQLKKLDEEFTELKDSIKSNEEIVDEEFKDAIGDMAVVLAGMAHMRGMTFEQCCEHAWGQIKNRTGHLNEEGIFVKD